MSQFGYQSLGFGGGASAAEPAVLENVAIVGNTAALEAITNQKEAFIAYNDATFQLWVSSGETTASTTIYTKQDSGT